MIPSSAKSWTYLNIWPHTQIIPNKTTDYLQMICRYVSHQHHCIHHCIHIFAFSFLICPIYDIIRSTYPFYEVSYHHILLVDRSIHQHSTPKSVWLDVREDDTGHRTQDTGRTPPCGSETPIYTVYMRSVYNTPSHTAPPVHSLQATTTRWW